MSTTTRLWTLEPRVTLSWNSDGVLVARADGLEAGVRLVPDLVALLDSFTEPCEVGVAIADFVGGYEKGPDEERFVAQIEEVIADLQAAGVLVPASEGASAGARSRAKTNAAVAPRYCCLLDEQPTSLAPEDQLLNAPKSSELTMNPRAATLDDSALDPLAAAFQAGPVISVEDPRRATRTAFWLGQNNYELFVKLSSGELAVGEIEPHAAERFIRAGILIDDPLRSTPATQARGNALAEQFRAGYVELGHPFHPYALGALRRYYRELLVGGWLALGDPQVPRRYVAYNEPVARYFHQELTSFVTEVVGSVIKPSYVYSASYVEGAELQPHTDREQCEYTVSLCLDYWPETEGATPWPLGLVTADGDVEVTQQLGDALLFRGRELPHFRTPLPAGHQSTSLFFHWVDHNFGGPLG